jgi:hypothetical protein
MSVSNQEKWWHQSLRECPTPSSSSFVKDIAFLVGLIYCVGLLKTLIQFHHSGLKANEVLVVVSTNQFLMRGLTSFNILLILGGCFLVAFIFWVMTNAQNSKSLRTYLPTWANRILLGIVPVIAIVFLVTKVDVSLGLPVLVAILCISWAVYKDVSLLDMKQGNCLALLFLFLSLVLLGAYLHGPSAPIATLHKNNSEIVQGIFVSRTDNTWILSNACNQQGITFVSSDEVNKAVVVPVKVSRNSMWKLLNHGFVSSYSNVTCS